MKNNRKKPTADNILGRIRSRQEDSEGNTKLREFLANLNEDGTTDESYQASEDETVNACEPCPLLGNS